MNKKTYFIIILISAIIGSVISFPLFFYLSFAEDDFCPKEEIFVAKNAPGCIDYDGPLKGLDDHCKDGNVYRWETTPCITEKTYFLFPLIIENLHPDMGVLLIYLLLIYGAVVGAIIGILLSIIIYLSSIIVGKARK